MSETAFPIGQIVDIPVDQVHPENNDRKVFDQAKLAQLADSIKRHGLAQAITVRPDPAGGYFLIAGERRWRAHLLAGLDTVRSVIELADDDRASDLMLIENTHRADLNPIDEAEAYQSRMDRFGLTPAELSARTGVSVSRITTYTPLLKLTPELRELVRSGALGVGRGYELIGQNGVTLDPDRQMLAFRAMNEHDLSVAQLRAVVAKLVDEQCQDSMFAADDFLRVEEYALTAKTQKAPKARLLTVLADVVAALETHDPDHPAAAAARTLLAA